MNSARILLCFISLSGWSCTAPFGSHSFISVSSPRLVWDQENYSLGQQSAGTSASHILNIENKGNYDAESCGPIQLTDLTNFSIVSTSCHSSIMKPGQKCEVVISSHPATQGQLSVEIKRQCRYNEIDVIPTSTMSLDVINPALVEISGAGFGDLATALSYVNQFKVGTPITVGQYDVGTDSFKFETEPFSDFSKAPYFLSGNNSPSRAAGILIDPAHLIQIYAGEPFVGSSNKTLEFGVIRIPTAGSLFNFSTLNNIKVKEYEFAARGLSYITYSTFEFDTLISNAIQPKFLFNMYLNVIINNDYVMNVGAHGRYTEFSDLNTSNVWQGGNVYDFKGNFTADNVRNITPGVASKINFSTFHFRKNFNITNGNGLRIFSHVGLTQDQIRGTNHVYFHDTIGASEGMDLPAATFGASGNVTYHVPATKQTSNAGGVEGDIQDIISRGGIVLFDLQSNSALSFLI